MPEDDCHSAVVSSSGRSPDVPPGKTVMPFDLDVVIIYINLTRKTLRLQRNV